MITGILIILAAICNAIMDVISHHYPRSIFSKYNPQWWNPRVSWQNKYIDWTGGNRQRNNKLTVFTDAWHFFKSAMIVFMICAICTYPWAPDLFGNSALDFIAYVWIYGILWNFVFWLFYHKLFRK